MIPEDHLQAKMGFDDDDLKVLRSGGNGDQIRILLEKKQQEKTLLKVKKMHEHRNSLHFEGHKQLFF